jgi:ParB-like chromosome segregation protein Spo0J
METTETTPNLDYIAPAIRHLAVPIDSVISDPSNVRRHSPRNIETIRGSLRRFKQQTPIVLDNNRIVRKGNGSLEAAKLEGWTHIAAVVSDLNGSELTSYAVADNRSGDPEVGSTFDQTSLAEVLTALQAEDAELATVAGFSPDEIASLIGATNDATAPEAPSDFDDFDESIDTEHECPKCGYVWSGSSAPKEQAE